MGKRTFLISGLLAIVSFWNIEIPKRAFRLYERGDILKTVEALDKSIAKDTLNPAGYYLYAQLYTDTAYAQYNVDTAYLYTNKAYEQLQFVLDPKDIVSLNELAVDSLNLEAQKDKIDSLKFLDIKAIHTISAYNEFMKKHADALQIPEAIELRNHIAFEKAEAINTWQSYQQFMNEFPRSLDFGDAEIRYKKLIYDERTADGSYESLTSFLEEFPNTPFRLPIEDGIFPYITAVNTLESFTEFLSRYPNRKYTQTLFNRAYHIYKTKYPDSDFFTDFDFGISTDSLKKAMRLETGLMFPKLENGTVAFMDVQGNIKLETSFKSLNQDCLCTPQSSDFLYGSTGEKSQVIGRNGQVIYEGVFDQAIEAGYGFIVIRNMEGDRLIHKSGEVIIDDPKEDIAILDNRFIRTKVKGLYGLENIEGLSYLANEYIQIDTFKTKFWLEKESGIQLIDPETLLPALKGENIAFVPQYDELDELTNGRIWVVRGDQESILDQQFKTIIPFAQQEVYERPYGWKIETSKGIKLVHDRYIQLLQNRLFNEVLENDRWLALKKDSTWSLLDQMGNAQPANGYDSLAFWGENMVMLFRNDSTWAQFKTGKRLLMSDRWAPKLLLPQEYITTGEKANSDFFMLTGAKNIRRIYNDHGRQILSSTYNDVTALGPNMLRLQKRNAALTDSTGKFILNFIYDGIGSSNKGYVSILDKGKVGVINPDKNVKIAPFYDKLIEPYADTVLIAADGDYKGFITIDNKELTTFEFDEIEYYTDTVALTRIEDEWLLYNISQDEALIERILEYKHIHNEADRKTLLIKTNSGKGVYSLRQGELVEPTYTDIKVLGTPADPIYFAMKLVAEADIYIVIYFDKNGNKLFTQSFREDEYLRIACPLK